MRVGDLVLVLVLLITFRVWIGLDMLKSDGDESGTGGYDFVVSIKGREVHRARLLSSDAVQHVTIPLDDPFDSEVVLEVANGRLRVLPMTLELCPKQVCCHFSSPISKPGQVIVCVPQEMIIRIEGDHHHSYDVLVG